MLIRRAVTVAMAVLSAHLRVGLQYECRCPSPSITDLSESWQGEVGEPEEVSVVAHPTTGASPIQPQPRRHPDEALCYSFPHNGGKLHLS